LAQLSTLFGEAVASEWAFVADDIQPLFEAESQELARAVGKRQREFRAGRHCARRALAQLGFAPSPILRRADRCPVWPEGSVGSIAHTGRGKDAVAVAAVARSLDRRSLGIDVEQNTELKPELYDRVLTSSEQAFLTEQAELAPGVLAKLSFSAKEAYYKCQYPLTRQFLDFTEVEIAWDLAGSRFEARVVKSDFPWDDLKVTSGRYLIDRQLLLSGVELALR
jgi:4'-phosphopantetheinyl transferase EntD